MKYFLLGSFASAFLVYGVALVYGATQTTNLAVVAPSHPMPPDVAVMEAMRWQDADQLKKTVPDLKWNKWLATSGTFLPSTRWNGWSTSTVAPGRARVRVAVEEGRRARGRRRGGGGEHRRGAANDLRRCGEGGVGTKQLREQHAGALGPALSARRAANGSARPVTDDRRDRGRDPSQPQVHPARAHVRRRTGRPRRRTGHAPRGSR